MAGKPFVSNAIDQHIGKRMQLRRNMMGMSLKDLAVVCGVTFQQIQKYETADNRIAASRLFEISCALQTPISFFFMGLPGNVPEETKASRSIRAHMPAPDDPMTRTESMELINLYWKLPKNQRMAIMSMLKTFAGGTMAED